MSDGARVLEELRSGPKTASELYRLHCIVHSRIADLRRDGHVIECTRTGGRGAASYLYTLHDGALTGGGGDGQPLLASGAAGAAPAVNADEQLSLVAA